MAENDGTPALPAPGDARQLRLAIVLYGGVSLAIYMHGSTKEAHRLVRASALLEQGLDGSGEQLTDLDRIYMRLLEGDGARGEPPLRVVIDVISGTSAGGINGVYLAKALAHDHSQDALRDLWLEEGDIDRLLWGPRWLPRWLKRMLAFLRGPFEPVLVGDHMSTELAGALERMEGTSPAPSPAPTTLMPADQQLDLFVTTTDFWGSPRQVMLDDPHQVADRAHRAVLHFHFTPGGDDGLSPEHNPVLAFAARATSCFPGAFPPVKYDAFRRLVGAPDRPLSGLVPEFARSFELNGVDPAQVWFIDGGVLDNRPFGHAIRAVREKPAGTEVDRRLVYLEPDPPGDDWMPSTDCPGQLPTLVGALSGIPRHEPILDDLLEVARLNERVWRIRRVIETNFDAIVAQVSALPGVDLDAPETVEPQRLDGWRTELRAQAAGGTAGLGYATYIRLRISDAVDRYGDAARDLARFPEDSSHAQLVRAVFRYWVGDELGLLEPGDDKQRSRLEFLRRFDLGYAGRLLRFLIAGVNWFYRDLRKDEPTPTREQLDRAKRLLYDQLDRLERITRPGDVPAAVTEAVTRAFPDGQVRGFLRDTGLHADVFVGENQDALRALDTALRAHVDGAYEGFLSALYEALLDATRDWPAAVRGRFLVRYLGFPLWDPILFPIQSLADAGERDAVEVQRWSPGGDRALPWTGEGPKLTGSTLDHFGAFLDRGGRERDYLWGRLDASERLVQLLVPGGDEERRREEFVAVARAILDEEEEHLRNAHGLIAELRRRLSA
jgi:patatin-related protein